jgi:hypothetical protein
MGYCKIGAEAAKEQWIHERNLRQEFDNLLIGTEEIERRAYWRGRSFARKRWASDFRRMKTEGIKTWVVEGNYLSSDREYFVSDTKEDFYVDERMRKTDDTSEAIKYLARVVSHEKLLCKDTSNRVRATLANLCALNEARYYNSNRHEFVIGKNALIPLVGEERAWELMDYRESETKRRENDSMDI